MGPDANTGEKVTLSKFEQLIGDHILNTSFVNHARGNMATSDQIA
jgi:hypothetical protein